jgi:hypothetical protein
MLWKYRPLITYSLGFRPSFGTAAAMVSACSSIRAIQNGNQPCPASSVPMRSPG